MEMDEPVCYSQEGKQRQSQTLVKTHMPPNLLGADAMMNASTHTYNSTISNSALAVARLRGGDGGRHDSAESKAAALAL